MNAYASELEQHYPRIAEGIVLQWGHPQLDQYVDRILIDERGDRQGFPETVVSELLFLQQVHDTLLNLKDWPDAKSVWADPQYIKSAGHDGSD
jgi:hypothetical protein